MQPPRTYAPGRLSVVARPICVVSDAVANLVNRAGLAAELDRRGILLANEPPAAPGRPVAAVLVSAAEATADAGLAGFGARHGLPVLTLGPGLLAGHLRLGEIAPGAGADDRLARLLAGPAAGLSPEAVAAALTRLGDPAPGPAVGPCPWPLSDAVTAATAADGHARDAVRRALAAEVLFNTAATPAALAPLIAEAIGAIGHRPRRSVSIIVNNYNYCRYLAQAVDSALAQTEPAAEVIVVDDGSTDGSPELIAGMDGIVTVLKPNGGQASALNAGFARATGELILFLDADDMLLPGAVAALAAARDHDAVRLQFGLETMDAHGRSVGHYAVDKYWMAAGYVGGAVASFGDTLFAPTTGNAFPRAVLERLLPMPEAEWRLCADLYLVLGAALMGETADLGATLGRYRVHGANGFYDVLFASAHLDGARIARRLPAWRSLAERLPELRGPGPLTDRLRLALHDLVLDARTQEGLAPERRPGWAAEAVRGLRLALAARSLPRGQRARHAWCAAWPHAKRRKEPVREAPDLIPAAGFSGWPRLEPGARLAEADFSGRCSPLGQGFARAPGRAGWLEAASGVLAFRLPEVAANWHLKLDFAVSGPNSLQGVSVRLNGATVAMLDLDLIGSIDLKLPGTLLLPWAAVAGEPGGMAAFVEIDVGRAQSGRLLLTGLAVDLGAASPVPFPVPPEGVFVGFGTETAGGRMLGAGWDWPDAGGARLALGSGELRLSLPDPGRPAALTLAFDPPLNGPAADLIRVEVNGRYAEAHDTPGHGALTLALPADIAGPDGRLDIRLSPVPDAATGAWPEIRLAAARVDVRRPSPHCSIILLPNIPVTGAAMADVGSALVPDGEAARLPARPVRLTLGVPVDRRGSRLQVSLAAAGSLPMPVALDISLNGRRIRALLSGRDVLTLDAGDGGQKLELVLEAGAPGHALAIEQIRLCLPPPRPSAGGAAGAIPDGILAPAEIAALANDALAWRLAEGETAEDPAALWLLADQACLDLPPMAGAGAVEVTVLTLPDIDQRLTIRLADARAETDRPGVQVLSLPLPSGDAGPQRLTVATNLMVAARRLGAGGDEPLGGALLSIRALADAQRQSDATSDSKVKAAE